MTKARVRRFAHLNLYLAIPSLLAPLLFSGCGSMNVSGTLGTPTIAISASPASIAAGSSSTLTVTSNNATQVTVTGNDGSTYTLQPNGGTQTVSPKVTTIYTAAASG